MRLKSWETPRTGRRRNDKSRQASARLRQLKKQRQQLRKQLKAQSKSKKASGPAPGAFVYGSCPTPLVSGVGRTIEVPATFWVMIGS